METVVIVDFEVDNCEGGRTVLGSLGCVFLHSVPCLRSTFPFVLRRWQGG